MKLKKLIYVPLIALAAFGCQTEEEAVNTTVPSQLGVDGVMPTIGKIYIDKVEVGPNDGDLTDMRKANLIYTLSGDIVLHDYSVLEGGGARCVWTSSKDDTKISPSETILARNEKTGVYECAPTTVNFNKSDDFNYDPDTVITITFKDNAGNLITRAGSSAVYANTITLNTTDRHNLVNLATSPTSVLFHRKDGLFQSGYTSYRGILGLDKYIGSATYEALVKAPGGALSVKTTDVPETYRPGVEEDTQIVNKWLNGTADIDNIKSDSAFVSSYGPPIALPPFRQGEIDYNKLRVVLMRHNNFPIIISNDKKLYTMGSISRYTPKDLEENFRYHIRANDNWFSYSGVDVYGDTSSNKLHVGEIKTANGVEARFVNTLSVTSDLGTIISLNETDREYYIAGNPHYNNSFCKEKATFSYDTLSFDFSNTCTYDSTVKVGAVKIPGLQRLIGDGNGAVATDNAIYYTGTDGRVYVVRIKPTDANYARILNGEQVMPEPLVWEYTEEDIARGAHKLYAVEIGLPNMNPALIPTILLNDGSVAFPTRVVDNETFQIKNAVKHFYVHKSGKLDAQPGEVGNVRIIKLLGPTAALGEDDKIYYFTDIPALGVSYNPQAFDNTTKTDKDYLSFVYGDPVQQFDQLKKESKQALFQFKYGELNINNALANLNDPNGQTNIGNDFVLMPYNPYTDSAEDYDNGTDGNIIIKSVPYRPYRTNAHLFVNMSKGAKYNYILVPHYMYAFDKSDRVDYDQWIYKTNGVMAAEVRHNDISKVFGTFTTPEVPFKYTPYGRNTAFFGNKKGIFAFVNYNARMTGSSFVDTKGITATPNTNDNATQVTMLVDNNTPDYFYRAKVVDSTGGAIDPNTVYEESSSRNNYIGNAFVNETRMSNYPNNENYVSNGFEPQLLSSWIQSEAKEYPTTTNNPQGSKSILPGYIPQYFFETVNNKYAGIGQLANDITTFVNGLYQYAYGVGMYRVYSTNVYPVWRARKFSTEILQLQARYGSLMPMTHGSTASYLFKNYKTFYEQGANFNNSGKTEDYAGKYLYPRLYTTTMYTTYDADMLKQLKPIEDVILGGIDISTQNLGNTIQNSAAADIDGKQGLAAQGSGVGYILLDGNYMWRAGSDAALTTGTPVSNVDPLNNAGYFSKFVAYH